MFSRIMRRPAGFVSMALRRTFRHIDHNKTESSPPDYWSHRYSAPGLSLVSPPGAASRRATTWTSDWSDASFARHLLLRQQGRAASFLALERKAATARA